MRRRTLLIIAAFALLGAIGGPLVAFVIVPQFVRATLVEALPTASAPAALVSGELVRIHHRG